MRRVSPVLASLEWDVPSPARPDTVLPAPPGPSLTGNLVWPSPPSANYAVAVEQTDALDCELVGLDGGSRIGRMTLFLAEDGVAYVQIPPARTTERLRLDSLRSLTLTAALTPIVRASTTGLAGSAATPPLPPYRVLFAGGGELSGTTAGHVEAPCGLFLFPPVGTDGSVCRLFIPRSALASFEVSAMLPAAGSPADPAVVEALRLYSVSTPDGLLAATQRQSTMPMVRIGEALTSIGLVSERQLEVALAHQQADRSVPLGEVLVKMGVISRADLKVTLARKMGYPVVDIDLFPVETEALHKVSYSAAQRLQVMPLMVRDGRLFVALDDLIQRRFAVDEVEFIAQLKVVPVLARCRDLDSALFAAYDRISAATSTRYVADQLLRPIDYEPENTGTLLETLESEDLPQDDDERPVEQSDNSLVRMINSMIVEAAKEGVSDIHIECYPEPEKIRVRFRKDGALYLHLELPARYRSALVARVKIMCDLDISEKRKPQDGKINFAKFSAQHPLELRVATIPTSNGLEDVVMRLLASAKPIPLDRLGLSESNLARLRQAAERPYGMVLCVGPTGSGKTTTLHSVLSHINVPERKIWTAEDPVEITQAGLRQVQINPRIDWTFAKALRSFLRADPDVIMVGEIRDAETAKMAIEASLTGHLVLSTLHTNSAAETVTRLLDMGMDPFNFADALLGVLAQRLVKRLCPDCRAALPASAEQVAELLSDYMHAFGPESPPVSREAVHADWLARYGKNGQLMTYRCFGCAHCKESGFKGRVGVHELMIVSRALRGLMQDGARAEALQACAQQDGMRTLRQDGIAKVLDGATTLAEVRATSNL